jgi:hypothetical protein
MTPITRGITLALAMLLVLPTLAQASAAQPVTTADPPLDAAAILLQPADLEAHRMSDLGINVSARYPSIESAMDHEWYARSRGTNNLQKLDGAEALLRDSGWQAMHERELARAQSDDPDSLELVVWSGIEEYDTAAGAEAAYQELARQDRIQIMTVHDYTVQQAQSDTILGDQTSLWHLSRPASTDRVSMLALSRWVLVDNAIVSVILINHADDEPDAAVVDSLTALLVNRLDAAKSQPGDTCGVENPHQATLTRIMGRIDAAPGLMPLPGLAPCIAVFDTPASMPVKGYYDVLGGTTLLYAGEDAESHATRQAAFEEIEIVHRYYSEQSLLTSSIALLDWTNPAYLRTTVTVYTDADAAATGMLELTDSLPADGFEVTPLGADRVSATHISESSGSHQSLGIARSGNMVVIVHIGRVTELVPDAAGALVDQHLACIDTGGCTDPVPLPPELH